MIKFRTEYKPEKSHITLSPRIPVIFIGSCFSNNMVIKMREALWEGINPTGTLYNPQSIASALRLCLLSLFPESEFEKSLFLSNNKYYSWLFDSKLSSYCAPDSMSGFRFMREKLLSTISRGAPLIVSFGTSYAYFLKGRDNTPVGNCHKQPEDMFDRRFLQQNEIVEVWSKLLKDLKKRFPSLKVIFTVSPVRHLKDGFTGNSRSKANLLLSVEQICRNHSFCDYFPAYEILTDDLRDYRFYASDLLHPSDEAIDYIWEMFIKTYLDDEGQSRLREGEKLRKFLNHHPLPDSSRLIPDDILKQSVSRREELVKSLIAFLDNDISFWPELKELINI